MSFELTHDLKSRISAHALAEYPSESCGIISDGLYFPSINAASDPTNDFIIPPGFQVQLHNAGRSIDAVVHSHPDGPAYPSDVDMRGQISMGLPWVIVNCTQNKIVTIEMWGGTVEPEPLIGRTFMHGIRDCYSLVRDAYRLGKDGMKAQDIDWPLDPVELPEYARKDSWWGDEKKLEQTLYVDNFLKAGFVRITREEARAGDGFIAKIRSKTPNHAAVLLGDGQLLHHLPTRYSRREPAGMWAHSADTWLRYEGVK